MAEMWLALSLFLTAVVPSPASKPTTAVADDDEETGDDDEAVDDEAAELDKLKEMQDDEQAGVAPILPPAFESFLPQNDIDAQKRVVTSPRSSHPEEVAELLAMDPGRLFGGRVINPGVMEAMWPMFVEYDGKNAFDPKDYDIPMVYNPMVENWMKFFTGRGREYFVRWMARSTRYIPVFREILKEHGLPQDLVYLSMIESGFYVRAFSKAKAAGPWQFMKYTGVRFGLKVDDWVDERRDWVKATHAAALYLKELNGQLGHWWLAWAGYNAGPGRVVKAMNRFDTNEFFDIATRKANRRQGGLHSETKQYVPKLIAAAIIAKSPRRFGFTNIEFMKPFEFETAEVEGSTDLRVVAQACETDAETMLEMNPALRYGITPPGKKFEIRIPRGTKHLLAKLPELQPKTKLTYKIHQARRGETLGWIAARYGSSVELVAKMNSLDPNEKLKRGMEVMVPIVPGVAPKVTPRPTEPVANATQTTRVAQQPVASAVEAKPSGGSYVVQAGDSLWSISQKYGCTVADLKRVNGISNHRGLQAGQSIKIP